MYEVYAKVCFILIAIETIHHHTTTPFTFSLSFI